MQLSAINRPNAQDLVITDIPSFKELVDCTHLLDDHAALVQFYQHNGYMLLRGVLDLGSVEVARDAMLAVAVSLGLAVPGDPTGKATGKPYCGGLEESELFAGISRRLLDHPANQALLTKVLGEPARSVPLTQYRLYPPHTPLSNIHQDGFYSPGIEEYRPVWVTLTPCTREMGGLLVAVGQNKGGFFHNVGKPGSFRIPRDAVPDDCWATTEYMPGDVLIVHPLTPHAGGPNTSDRLRVSFDSRVQSAHNPTAVAATVVSVTPHSITVDAGDLGLRTLKVDADTFIRVLHPGVREPFESFVHSTKPGMRLVVVSNADRALMLRRASEV